MSHQSDSNAAKEKLKAAVLPLYSGIANPIQQAAFAEACIQRGGPTYGANKSRLQVSDFPGMTNARFNEIAAGNKQWVGGWWQGEGRPSDALSDADFEGLLFNAGVAAPIHHR